MPNTHRVYVRMPDGREVLKASGKEAFCDKVAENHRSNGRDAFVKPIPPEDLR